MVDSIIQIIHSCSCMHTQIHLLHQGFIIHPNTCILKFAIEEETFGKFHTNTIVIASFMPCWLIPTNVEIYLKRFLWSMIEYQLVATIMLEQMTSTMEKPTNGHAYNINKLPISSISPLVNNANHTNGQLSCNNNNNKWRRIG
jgi:hypothetical protein